MPSAFFMPRNAQLHQLHLWIRNAVGTRTEYVGEVPVWHLHHLYPWVSRLAPLDVSLYVVQPLYKVHEDTDNALKLWVNEVEQHEAIFAHTIKEHHLICFCTDEVDAPIGLGNLTHGLACT